MLPNEIDKTIPENQEQSHETLSDIEKVPPRSFQERMRRDPEFRFYVEEHD
jgi:hypothetical protein